MIDALSSDVQTRGCIRRVTWPRFSCRPHPWLQIEVRWLNLANQNEMLVLHMQPWNWPFFFFFLVRSYTTSYFHLLDSCWELADTHSLYPKVEWELNDPLWTGAYVMMSSYAWTTTLPAHGSERVPMMYSTHISSCLYIQGNKSGCSEHLYELNSVLVDFFFLSNQ